MIKRNKFELLDLANQILNKFPESLFVRSDTLFLDPDMGGGQFVKAVEDRLRRYGHDDENIRTRVHGFGSVLMDVNYAVNKLGLVGKYSVVSPSTFLNTESLGMKFDVIVGNPPYQDGNQGLWQSFARKSVDLLKDGGALGFVTPNSWANGSHLNTEKNVFNSILQRYNCIEIKTNVNEYFKGVGKNISTWTILKEPYKGTTTVVDKNGTGKEIDISKYPFFINVFSFEALEIFQRVLEYGQFYSEFVERKNTCSRVYAFPKIRHNAGYRKGYLYDDINFDFPTSPVVVGIDCQDKTLEQVKSIHSQFESKLFRFLWKIYGADDAGSFGWILRNMPKLPDNRIYTDQDVYSELNLIEFADYIDDYLS